MLSDKMKEFDKAKESITPEESYKGAEHVRTIGSEIASMRVLPTYLASGVKFVFSFYILTALFSLFWLTNVVQNSLAEGVLLLLFILSTLGFFGVVWNATGDIHELMKEEFEQLKKKQKEASDMSVIVET
jgi:hypothetical protein